MNDAAFRIMRLLEENPRMSQRELSERLGVSVGRVNYCLRGLIEKGHVKLENFRASPNKHRYAYVLTPAGIAERVRLTIDFLDRRLTEYEHLHTEIDRILAETGHATEATLDPELVNRLRAVGLRD